MLGLEPKNSLKLKAATARRELMPHFAPNPSIAPACFWTSPRLQATTSLFQLLHQLKNSTWFFYFPDENDVLTMSAAAAEFMWYYTSIFGRTTFFFILRYLWLLLLFCVSCMTTTLDPDPSTRIPISRIKKSAWYRRPAEVNAKKNESRPTHNNISTEAASSGSTGCSTSEGNQGSLSLPNLNAFDIISLSTGFNLSGFFEDEYGRREERFTTRQPVTIVLTKLKELAKRLKLKIKKKENGVLKLAAPKEGKKGFLELDAKIFEVAPSFLLVELKKTNGDTMEYQKLVKEEVRPALKDIVWVWQGDQHQQSQPILQGGQHHSLSPTQQPHDELQPPLQQQEGQDQLPPPLQPQEQQEQPPLPPQNGFKHQDSHGSNTG